MIRLLALIVILLLSVSWACSQESFVGQITGAVVTGGQPGVPLQGVILSVETPGKLVAGGETDEAGRFHIDLSRLMPNWRTAEKKERHLAIRFAKSGYEEVIWVFDCHVSGQAACEGLAVGLTPLPKNQELNTEVAIDPDEIDIL